MRRSRSTSGCGNKMSPDRRLMPRCSARRGSSRLRMSRRSSPGSTRVAADYDANGVAEDLALEDIHMQTEARLAEAIGPAAGRLHTARSRNDQVATDFRLWVRDAIDAVDAGLGHFQQALARTRAEEHAASVMPGFTHLQSAQPVTLGSSPDGLSRDDRARPRALRRCARADEPVAARLGGAGRHGLPD